MGTETMATAATVDAPISAPSPQVPGRTRIDWIDYSKGICMILVVMMHTVINYETLAGSEGWLRPVVDFAQPFRMPDFFLIAGLFLHRSINSDASAYYDRKVVHFAYFYVLWLVILMPFKEMELLFSNPIEFGQAVLWALIEPVNALWFLHMLAIFYVVVRLTRHVPIWLMLLVGLALNTGYKADWIDTEWTVLNRFADRFIYFYIGYVAAQYIFKSADLVRKNSPALIAGLLIWGIANWYMAAQGWHHVPLVAPVIGLIGAAAVCALGVLMAKHRVGDVVRYVGQNSLVVYLTFYIPMKVTEKVIDRIGDPLGSVGLSTAIILFVAVASPLVFAWIIRKTPLNFLYVRPDVLKLKRPVPAE
ncbi:MAG: acyltransferase family protein [Pseudomonadota bacterium]